MGQTSVSPMLEASEVEGFGRVRYAWLSPVGKPYSTLWGKVKRKKTSKISAWLTGEVRRNSVCEFGDQYDTNT